MAITAIAVIATGVSAQDDPSALDGNASGWRESVMARCVQEYSAEQCEDSEFLEENFHVKTLEIARRAATQRNRQEEKALRELTLQRVCGVPASRICAQDSNAAQCIAQIEQACATLKAEAYDCAKRAPLGCANEADPQACTQRRMALCPSFKKQPIQQLLAKYPRLSAAQKSRLTAAAAELDAKTKGWWSNLSSWLKLPLR